MILLLMEKKSDENQCEGLTYWEKGVAIVHYDEKMDLNNRGMKDLWRLPFSRTDLLISN